VSQKIAFFVIESFDQIALISLSAWRWKELNLYASSNASCFLAFVSASRSCRLRLSFGSFGAFFDTSGGGDGRIGGVDGLAGSKICVDVETKRFCIFDC
jgi:hypothetical protein